MKRIILFLALIFLVFTLPLPAYAQLYNLTQNYSQNYWNQDAFFWPIPSSTYDLNNNLFDYTRAFQNYSAFQGIDRFASLTTNIQTSWFNHPPILSYGPERPMVLKAGQPGATNFWAIDPDADLLYASSSLGATGGYSNGSLTWTFSTNFPGWYSVDTLVYDERGGFAMVRSPVYVKPWWSF